MNGLASSASTSEMIPPRWRLVARLGFLAVVALTVIVFAGGLPEYYRQLTTVCAAAPCGNSPTAEVVQTYQAAGLSMEGAARWLTAMVLLSAVVPGTVALVIFWRRADNRMAWFTALTLLTFGAFGVHDAARIAAVLATFPAAWSWPTVALTVCGSATITVFFFVFPDGRFQPPRLRWAVGALLAFQVVGQVWPDSPANTATWPLPFMTAYWCVFLGLAAYAQVYRYRRVANFQQRQQTKWVVLGVALALGGAMIGFIALTQAPLVNPDWAVLGHFADSSYYLFLHLIPLSIGFAMFRSRLYDVDVVINRALVYGLVTALLASIYAGLVIGLQTLFTRFTGQTSDLALIGSTLAIVALFQPLRRGVEAFIARRFYRRRYDSQQVLTAFAGVLRDRPYTDPDDLRLVLLNVVDETIQPAHVTLRLVEGAGPKPGA